MTASAESTRDRVVVVRRRFVASREVLFRAWTHPASFARWFGPKGWAVDRCELDPRPGGYWRAWLRTSKGAGVYVGGVYSEVEPDRRLVFTWDTNAQGSEPESLSVVSIEFRDAEGGAEVCITHRKLGSAQAVDMDAGWNNTFDSLEEYVGTQAINSTIFDIRGGRAMSSKAYTGGCNCGAVRYESAADPVMMGHCQCRDCQYESGSGHASQIAFPRAAVKVEGKVTQWDKRADSGNVVTRAFCPTCGSPAYSLNSGTPELFFVRAASLDDPSRFAPQMIVYTSSGFSWDYLDPALPRFEKMPPMAAPR